MCPPLDAIYNTSSRYEIVRQYSHSPHTEAIEGLDCFDTYHEADNFLRKYFRNGEWMSDEYGRYRHYVREITEAEIDELERHYANMRFASYVLD